MTAAADHRRAVGFLLDWLGAQPVFTSVKAVGHRVVHGMKHSEPERVTPKLLAELRRITPHDPDHLPREKDKPVIFAFHAYPWWIHRLTYRRTKYDNLHVRGHKEEGTITTPFDMTVLNDLDRFHRVMDTIDRLPQTGDFVPEFERLVGLHGTLRVLFDMTGLHGWTAVRCGRTRSLRYITSAT